MDRPRAHILGVDDSQAMRSILADVLERAGHQVHLASSGEEALEMLDQVHIDLVVADLVLPEMDGYELCRRVKDLDPECPVPVLLLTSTGDLDSKLAGFDAGADDYLLKPVRPEELAARVRVALRIRRMQEQLRERNRRLERTRAELESNLQHLEAALREIRSYQARTDRELHLASRVQRAILPARIAELPGVHLEATYQPALAVAGDFYDVVAAPEGRWVLAVGDVAGKGAGASLLMVLAVTALRQAVLAGAGPAETLREVNRRILEEYGQTDMITVFLAELDPATRRLRYSSAGHEPALLHRAGGDRIEPLEEGGPFLGIFPELALDEGELELGPGDAVLAVTDGVLDRFAHQDTLTGQAALRAAFLARDGARGWLDTLPPAREVGETDDATALLLEVE